MIPHVHIYFITFHNKCLYNYSYPHAASKAHFNANPTTYIYNKSQPYRKVLQLLVGLEAWQCRLDHLYSPAFWSSIPIGFCLTKALQDRLTCVQRSSLKRQPAPLNCFFAFYGADSTVHLIWTAGSSHLQLLIVCVEYTCLCIHSHTHLSDLKKCLCVFYWLLHRL